MKIMECKALESIYYQNQVEQKVQKRFKNSLFLLLFSDGWTETKYGSTFFVFAEA